MNGWEEADWVSMCVSVRLSASALSSVFMCKRKPLLALRCPHRCLFVVTARFVLPVLLFITLSWLYGCSQNPRRGHNRRHGRYAWVSNTAVLIHQINLLAWISRPLLRESRLHTEYRMLICSFFQLLIYVGYTEQLEENLKAHKIPSAPNIEKYSGKLTDDIH